MISVNSSLVHITYQKATQNSQFAKSKFAILFIIGTTYAQKYLAKQFLFFLNRNYVKVHELNIMCTMYP